MSCFNCGHCGKWCDGDYVGCEEHPFRQYPGANLNESLVCENCAAELAECACESLPPGGICPRCESFTAEVNRRALALAAPLATLFRGVRH